MRNDEDLRWKPYSERKAMLLKSLRRSRAGIQYVEHTEGGGSKMFNAACKLGLEGIVSKKLNAPYRSSPSRPRAAAGARRPTRIVELIDRTKSADAADRRHALLP